MLLWTRRMGRTKTGSRTQAARFISEKGLELSCRDQKSMIVTADSSTVAEFIATHLASKEIMWARAILEEMGYGQDQPTVLGEDNMSTIAMINNDSNGQKTKHIAIRFNLIREQVRGLAIQLQHLPTKEMTSDILTKALDPKPFAHLRRKLLGMVGLKI